MYGFIYQHVYHLKSTIHLWVNVPYIYICTVYMEHICVRIFPACFDVFPFFSKYHRGKNLPTVSTPDVLHRLGPLDWLLWFGRFEEGWKGPLEVENSEFTPYNNRPLLKAPKGKVNFLKNIIFVGANC